MSEVICLKREGNYGSISYVTNKLAENSEMDIHEVEHPEVPILSHTFQQNISIPRKLREIEGDYEKVFIPSYELMTNLDPSDFNLEFYVYVHDLYRVFQKQTLLQKINTKRAIKNFRKAENIIANSDTTRTVLENTYFQTKKIDVVPPGVSEEFYPEDERPEIEGLPDKYILYVGTFHDRKNTGFLLEVLNELPEDFELVMAGNYQYEQNKQEFLEKAGEMNIEGRVQVLGYIEEISNLRKLYSSAYCYLHPAKRGGFEITPLEAAACGTKVVTNSKLPSSKYFSEESSLYEEFNSKEVSSKIQKADFQEMGDSITWQSSGRKLAEIMS